MTEEVNKQQFSLSVRSIVLKALKYNPPKFNPATVHLQNFVPTVKQCKEHLTKYGTKFSGTEADRKKEIKKFIKEFKKQPRDAAIHADAVKIYDKVVLGMDRARNTGMIDGSANHARSTNLGHAIKQGIDAGCHHITNRLTSACVETALDAAETHINSVNHFNNKPDNWRVLAERNIRRQLKSILKDLPPPPPPPPPAPANAENSTDLNAGEIGNQGEDGADLGEERGRNSTGNSVGGNHDDVWGENQINENSEDDSFERGLSDILDQEQQNENFGQMNGDVDEFKDDLLEEGERANGDENLEEGNSQPDDDGDPWEGYSEEQEFGFDQVNYYGNHNGGAGDVDVDLEQNSDAEDFWNQDEQDFDNDNHARVPVEGGADHYNESGGEEVVNPEEEEEEDQDVDNDSKAVPVSVEVPDQAAVPETYEINDPGYAGGQQGGSPNKLEEGNNASGINNLNPNSPNYGDYGENDIKNWWDPHNAANSFPGDDNYDNNYQDNCEHETGVVANASGIPYPANNGGQSSFNSSGNQHRREGQNQLGSLRRLSAFSGSRLDFMSHSGRKRSSKSDELPPADAVEKKQGINLAQRMANAIESSSSSSSSSSDRNPDNQFVLETSNSSASSKIQRQNNTTPQDQFCFHPREPTIKLKELMGVFGRESAGVIGKGGYGAVVKVAKNRPANDKRRSASTIRKFEEHAIKRVEYFTGILPTLIHLLDNHVQHHDELPDIFQYAVSFSKVHTASDSAMNDLIEQYRNSDNVEVKGLEDVEAYLSINWFASLQPIERGISSVNMDFDKLFEGLDEEFLNKKDQNRDTAEKRKELVTKHLIRTFLTEGFKKPSTASSPIKEIDPCEKAYIDAWMFELAHAELGVWKGLSNASNQHPNIMVLEEYWMNDFCLYFRMPVAEDTLSNRVWVYHQQYDKAYPQRSILHISSQLLGAMHYIWMLLWVRRFGDLGKLRVSKYIKKNAFYQ